MPERSVDLAVMNSVAQYMSSAELDAAFAVIKRLLKPGGRLVVGDILRPEVGMARDVLALLRFAARHGFLKDALIGLVSTALSDYRQLRTRVGLQRYSEAGMVAKLAAAGFTASRAPFQYRAQSVADDLRGPARPEPAHGRLGLIGGRRGSPRRDRQ